MGKKFSKDTQKKISVNKNSISHLLMLSAPLLEWRHVKITNNRTKQDCAHVLKDLADGHFPEKKIVVVMDNLNMHKLTTLQDTFKPTEACRLARQFAVRHTSKIGSWLNMAAMAINVLTHQCRARCIPDRATMGRETNAWADYRNETAKPIDWQFSAEDARIKLKPFYPLIQ